jgi:hypothetical protein
MTEIKYYYMMTWIIHQQLEGYKVEDKFRLGAREQRRLNTTGLENVEASICDNPIGLHGLLQR